jgi:hypothetical protein
MITEQETLFIQKYADRIIEIAQHFNDYTTSDLQGIADAIVLDIVRDCNNK